MADRNHPSPSLPPSLPHSPRCAWLLFFDLCPSLAGGRSRCPELANNNQGVALCDTPSLGLDNDQAADGRYAGEWQPLHRGPLRERGSLRVRMRRPSQRSSHPPTRPRHISSPCEHANTQLKLTQAGRFDLCFSSSSKSWPTRLQFLVQRLFFVVFSACRSQAPPTPLHPSSPLGFVLFHCFLSID